LLIFLCSLLLSGFLTPQARGIANRNHRRGKGLDKRYSARSRAHFRRAGGTSRYSFWGLTSPAPLPYSPCGQIFTFREESMNRVLSSAIVVAGLVLTLSGVASWAVSPPPPNNDVSDDNGNTAGGTDALKITTGVGNTAFGHAALSGDTRGYENTAVGDGPLVNNSEGYRNTAI